ncbi:hypothetical protein FACS189467_5700 [Bacteroidia bacterium]|nr:hypothetical protein FACS189467_5700 [Bacteroidia bacterium]
MLLAQRGRALAEDTTSVIVVKKPDTMTLSQMWKWSLIAPGFGQVFNKQYWKASIVWVGMGGMLYKAYQSNANLNNIDAEMAEVQKLGLTPNPQLEDRYNHYQLARNLYIAGAGVTYLWSMLDGVSHYRFDNGIHSPSKAAIYSTLFPGMGQAYNKKYWKLPLVYGGFLGFGYLIQSRAFRYNMFSNEYNIRYELNEVTRQLNSLPPEDPAYEALQNSVAALDSKLRLDKNWSLDRLKSAKDSYRRDRDYYIILTCLFYGINIIDAVVDAHFFTYDVSNDLSFRVTPFVEQFANTQSAVTGMSLSFKF